MTTDLVTALAELNTQQVLAAVRSLKAQGTSPLKIIAELQAGMDIVGKRYEQKEYFLSELIMSADIFKAAAALLEDAFTRSESNTIGTLVIGTVQEDIHDIGKNIVNTVMSCNGFRVHDLGVDVLPETFVAAIQQYNPQFVGISCLLTTAFENMKRTIEEIQKAGLRKQVKILIGGGPVDETVRRYVAADYYCKDAQYAVELCRQLLGKSKLS